MDDDLFTEVGPIRGEERRGRREHSRAYRLLTGALTAVIVLALLYLLALGLVVVTRAVL